MQLKCVFKNITFCLVFGIMSYANAIDKRFEKKFINQYHFQANGSLFIENAYGDITILPSNNDTVYVETLFYTNLPEMMDTSIYYYNVDVNTSLTGLKKSFKTVLHDNLDMNNPFHVDYTIHIPQNANFDIINKFGNITSDSVSGNWDINCEYGSVSISAGENIAQNKKIKAKISFGEIQIDSMAIINLNIENAKANIIKARSLDITASFAGITIGEAETVAINGSENDIITLGKTNNLLYNGSESTLNTGEISNRLQINGNKLNVGETLLGNQFISADIAIENSIFNLLLPNAPLNIAATLKDGENTIRSELMPLLVQKENLTTINGFVGDSTLYREGLPNVGLQCKNSALILGVAK